MWPCREPFGAAGMCWLPGRRSMVAAPVRDAGLPSGPWGVFPSPAATSQPNAVTDPSAEVRSRGWECRPSRSRPGCAMARYRCKPLPCSAGSRQRWRHRPGPQPSGPIPRTLRTRRSSAATADHSHHSAGPRHCRTGRSSYRCRCFAPSSHCADRQTSNCRPAGSTSPHQSVLPIPNTIPVRVEEGSDLSAMDDLGNFTSSPHNRQPRVIRTAKVA